ncbi:MAG: OmpA family protein [Bacteroidaceae bacterium]|jgi:chemotaxis protein MotB|nr:OmpA family protein [Bacteroidaceae bacterium]
MKKGKLIAMSLMAAALLTTGCASKKALQECQDDFKSLQDKFSAQSLELKEAQTNVTNLNTRIADAQQELKDQKRANTELQKALSESINQGGANISKLVDEINASNKYIKQLVEAKSKSDSLNMALTNKLTKSLSKEELKDVDVQVLKGVVYISLNDNMLYKSGSYEISPKAAETLQKIAKIITDYSDYEVLVEGNTDNVPISKTNIRNNWDLSALRASSVVQELQNKYGVNPSRLTAGGRGEYNPVADNSTDAGRSKNRRTQIIITPKLDQFLDLIDQAPADEEETK